MKKLKICPIRETKIKLPRVWKGEPYNACSDCVIKALEEIASKNKQKGGVFCKNCVYWDSWEKWCLKIKRVYHYRTPEKIKQGIERYISEEVNKDNNCPFFMQYSLINYFFKAKGW